MVAQSCSSFCHRPGCKNVTGFRCESKRPSKTLPMRRSPTWEGSTDPREYANLSFRGVLTHSAAKNGRSAQHAVSLFKTVKRHPATATPRRQLTPFDRSDLGHAE